MTSFLESALIAYSFEVISLFAKLAKVKMTTTKVCTILNGIFKTKSEVNLQRGFKCYQTRKIGYFEIDTRVADNRMFEHTWDPKKSNVLGFSKMQIRFKIEQLPQWFI